MSKVIRISDKVYLHICKFGAFNESFDNILRRLLKIKPKVENDYAEKNVGNKRTRSLRK